MERTLPIDLENARPRIGLRGYNRDDVDTLLKGAARTLEVMIAENTSLREQVERMRVEIDRYRADDQTLKDALISAQKAADETRALAQKQADLILEEARQSALAERVAVQQKVSELRWDVERLRQERMRCVEEFRSLLERQLRELATITPYAVTSTESPSVAV